MLTQRQIEEFHRLGFLKAGRIMSDSQADRMCERMFQVIEGQSHGKAESVRNLTGADENVVVQIVNIWEADDLFRAHIYNPVICLMVSELMASDTVRVWHDQVQYKPPTIGGPTDWHQDHPYWPIIQPADLISAWVALDDATVENGCMSMVPRSHLWGPHKGGTIGTRAEDFAPQPDMSLLPPDAVVEVVPCEVKKGEVMFHHCLTWHGSPPNRSSKGRPGIAVHYMPGYTRYEPHGATHLVEHNVEVAPGEVLKGKSFPTVWEGGRAVSP
ncbi:MAG TPA: phytanoyl-CoA dioxygenase family protein [Chthonomonadales bacterium]|nr:phytanoyl-CoA dioxygenase family protein [Chthonomonadales bacterium]